MKVTIMLIHVYRPISSTCIFYYWKRLLILNKNTYLTITITHHGWHATNNDPKTGELENLYLRLETCVDIFFIHKHTVCVYMYLMYMYVSVTSIIFWFDSLSFQAFGVIKSKYSSPEIFKQKEPPYIITPLPSVSQLSKDISYLPVPRCQSEEGQFLYRQTSLNFKKKKKTRQFIQPLLSLKFLIHNHLKRNYLFSQFYWGKSSTQYGNSTTNDFLMATGCSLYLLDSSRFSQ